MSRLSRKRDYDYDADDWRGKVDEPPPPSRCPDCKQEYDECPDCGALSLCNCGCDNGCNDTTEG